MKWPFMNPTAIFLLLVGSLVFAQATAPLSQPIPGQSGPPADTRVVDAVDSEGAPSFLPKEIRWHYDFVKAYMRQKSPLGQVGAGPLSEMGDEAAFHVFFIMGKRPPLAPDQTLTVLDILHSAFAKPEMIQHGGDLEPNKTRQLLKIIEKTAVDQRVKERIAIETNFLQTVPKKIVRGPLVNTGPVRDIKDGGALPLQSDFEPKK